MKNVNDIQRKSDGTIVYKADLSGQKKFKKTQKINSRTIEMAEGYVDDMRLDYINGIQAKISSLKTLTDELHKAGAPETIEQLKREVLEMKSSAGMFGYPLVTALCELFFDIFDCGYDLNTSKVRKTINLYTQTIQEVLLEDKISQESEYAQNMLKEFRQLNKILLRMMG